LTPLATTQWTARRLGFQPQLGLSWFEFARAGVHVPLASFWWWCHDDACTPTIFIQGTAIATSGGFALIGIAIGVLVWRAPEDGPVFLDRDLGPIFRPHGGRAPQSCLPDAMGASSVTRLTRRPEQLWLFDHLIGLRKQHPGDCETE